MSHQFAYRASYFGSYALVKGNSVNLGTRFNFVHQSTFGGSYTDYASKISQTASVVVVVQSAYPSPDDWFLGEKAPFQLQLYNGWTVMSYNMCCRISTLQNNNNDEDGILNFLVNGSETSSLRTTGLAREYFAQYAPADYIVPVVHPDSSYTFGFAMAPISGNTYQISGLRAAFPASSTGCSGGRCTCSQASTCPTTSVPQTLAINAPNLNYYGITNGVSTDNGRLLWTPTTQGLFALQVIITAGVRYPLGCSWNTVGCTLQSRSTTALDFIIAVIPSCLTTSTNCNHNPYFSSCACPGCGCALSSYSVTFYAGVQKTFVVNAVDTDSWQVVTVQNSIIPSGATFSQTQTGNPAKYLFAWTPLIDQVSSVTCFKAVDNGRTSNGGNFPTGPAYSLGNFCIQLIIGKASLLYVSGIVRDFKASHNDFARANGDSGVANNFVATTLGADNLPVFNTNFTGRTTTTTANTFNQWFRSVPNVNMEQVYSLTLSNGSVADPRIYTYYTTIFWPIDGLLFGNEGQLHNNYFTYEIHTYMGYNGGEVYEYQSSDDLWIFVNRLLPPNWNLNGIHAIATYTLNMDRVHNTSWKLAMGGIYTCDIFYAHRGLWTGPLTHDPGLQLQLPNAVLCNAISSGVLTIDFSPNFGTQSYSGGAANFVTRLGSASIVAATGSLNLSSVSFPSFAGAAWFNALQGPAGQQTYSPTLLKVLQGFEATFNFQFSNVIGSGAPEGFAFVLQNSAGSALGSDGNGLGYTGIPLSVAIEFDAKQDTSLQDPAYDHVSLHTRYSQPNSNSETHSLGISINNPPMTFENGTAHKIVIRYQPAQDDTQGTMLGWMYVWMNANLAPVMACQIDMASLKAAFNGAAYVGFTAGQGPSTGGLANIAILNWQTTIVGVSATFTGIITPSQQAVPALMTAGGAQADTYLIDGIVRPGVLVVQTRDACNNKIFVGNDAASFTVTMKRRAGSAVTVTPVVVANGDGTYTVTYNPTESGVYDIDIRWVGIPIANSPYTVTVQPDVAVTTNSYIVPSRIPYAPNTADGVSGMQTVAVNPTSGLVISNTVFDTTTSSGAADFAAAITALPAGTVVALACSGSCVPVGGLAAAARTAITSVGGAATTGVTTLAVGGSYALIGIKGGAAGSATEQVQNARATSQLSRSFTPTSNALNNFVVTAASGGASFGQNAEMTEGGFARIAVIPNGVFVSAGTYGTIYIQDNDKYGNPQSVGVDTLQLSLAPDITLTGGNVSDTANVGPAYYTAQFYSTVSGDYQLYIKLSTPSVPTFTSISNSPLSVHIIPAAAYAPTSSAGGTGLSSATSAQLACFQLTLKDVYGNTLTSPNPLAPDAIAITLTSTTLSPVTTITMGTTAGSTTGWVDSSNPNNPCVLGSVCLYQVCYTPVKADLYNLRVVVNGADMPTTQSVQVQPGAISPAQSQLTGPGIAPNSEPVVAGQPSTLTLQTYDAAGNQISIQGPFQFQSIFRFNGADVSTAVGSTTLSYVGNGVYMCTWVPVSSGAHSVTIQYNNPQLGASARLVGTPAQPFTVNVVPGAPSYPSFMTAMGSGTIIAGDTRTLNITGRDINGNLVNSGTTSAFVVKVAIDPSTGSQSLPSIVTPVSASGNTFLYTWSAQQSGSYLITTKMADTGAELSNSPLTVTVLPGTPECSMFQVTGFGQYGGAGGSTASFTIQARDVYGNNARVDTLVLVVTVASGTATVTPRGGNSGAYDVSYTAPAGIFPLSAKMPVNPANPNTVLCTLFDRVSNFAGSAFSYARPESSAGHTPESSWNMAQAGVAHTFFIVDYNSTDYNVLSTVSPHATFTVNFVRSSDSQRFNNAAVTPLAQLHNSTVVWTPSLAGTYTFNISRTSGIPAVAAHPDFGWEMTVIPGVISPPATLVYDLSGTKTVGETYNFTVQLVDAFTNLITDGTYTLTATVDSGVGAQVFTATFDPTTKLYVFLYSSNTVGNKQVVVSHSGTALQQSFFPLTFVAAEVDAARSFVTLPAQASSGVVAGTSFFMTVTLRDRFNNPTGTASSCPNMASCVFSLGFSGSPAVAPVFVPSFQNNGVFQVQVTPYGTGSPLTLQATVGGTQMGTSSSSVPPYLVTVTPAGLNATQSQLSGFSGAHVAGVDVVGTLRTFDHYGNPWRSGTGLITATVQLCTSSTCSALVAGPSYQLQVAPLANPGEFSLTFLGGVATKAGYYKVIINALSVAFVPSGDASIIQITAAALHPPFTTITTIPNIVVHSALTEVISTFDQFFNPILTPTSSAVVTYDLYYTPYLATGYFLACDTGHYESRVEAPVKATPESFIDRQSATYIPSTGQWNLTFTPADLGYYYLNISINDQQLPCATLAQLAFRVIAGPGYPPYSTVTGPATATAGDIITFVVSVVDQYGFDIDRPSTQAAPYLDVQFGIDASTPYGSADFSLQSLYPSTSRGPQSSWLTTTAAGPHYDAGLGYPGCVPDSTTRCPAVKLLVVQTSSICEQPYQSRYCVVVQPVKAMAYQLVATFKGGLINNASSVTTLNVLPGAATSFVPYLTTVSCTNSVPCSFDLQGSDAYGNHVTSNNHSYIVSVSTTQPVAYSFTITPTSTAPFAPPRSMGNGVHRITFTPQLTANYSVYVTLVLANGQTGFSSSLSGSPNLVVAPQSCGWTPSGAVSSTPYRCPDGSCVASYTNCPSNSAPICPNNQVMCSDGNCQASASLCPCGPGLQRCPGTTACVATCPAVPLCPLTAPIACTDASGVKTGECRAQQSDCPSPLVCTPGTRLCPDGISCAYDLGKCTVHPTCSGSKVQCANGQCVDSLADCPTSTTCPAGQVVCASDGSCQTSASKCPAQYECYEPTSVRCSDGSCRATANDCPSSVTCPVGYVKCSNGACAASLSECLPMFNCPLSMLQCPDGTCSNSTVLCPTEPSCPSTLPVLCSNGQCVSTAALCNLPQACPTTSAGSPYLCPSGACVSYSSNTSAIANCPTQTVCPADTPVRCSYGACVKSASDCNADNVAKCPAQLPYYCSIGACALNLANCPSMTLCPASTPVRCPDGTCALTSTMCSTPDEIACPVGKLTCPDGSCASSLQLCPTIVTCPLPSVRCVDGSCRYNVEGSYCPTSASPCPPIGFPLATLTCPSSTTGTTCVSDLSDCPQSPVCPVTAPVMCLDRTCAASISQCPSVPVDYPQSLIACPDGTWAASSSLCGMPTSCPKEFPYKCADSSCRLSPNDCVVPIAGTCGADRPYLCPTGQCVATMWASACSSQAVSKSCLDPNFPVHCANGACVHHAVCNGTETSPQCCDGSSYMEDAAETGGCPNGYTRCFDGTCVAQKSFCSSHGLKCSASLPYMCQDGMCAQNSSACNEPLTGCRNQLFQCWDGSCALDVRMATCPDRSQPGLSGCPPGYTLCEGGSLGTGYGQCVQGSTCPTPIRSSPCPLARCLDGTCVNSFSDCIGSSTSAVVPIPNTCPATAPQRCPDGYCAESLLFCVPTNALAESCSVKYPGLPFRCASGQCVLNPDQCPVVRPCGTGEQRCGNGMCMPTGTCAVANTCPYSSLNPTVQLQRCTMSGLCVDDLADCIVDRGSACPPSKPVRCPSGVCSATGSTSECAGLLNNGHAKNGCALATPFKCPFSGACVADLNECVNSVGCYASAPYACPTSGTCAVSPAACPSTPCSQYTCSNGRCVAEASLCPAVNGCPAATPVRCLDGSCAKYAANSGHLSDTCPVGLFCEANQEQCADGSCVPANSGLCPVAASCPSSAPFRCPAGNCVVASAQCGNLCPATAPVLCSTGACAVDPSQCPVPKTCPGTQVLCADGSCKDTHQQCVTYIVTVNNAAEGTLCTGSSVLCSDGSCAPSEAFCPPIPACPRHNIRCPDGTCKVATEGQRQIDVCGVVPACTNPAQSRCEDGICRTKCLPYNGCGLRLPYMCQNRECASYANEDLCASIQSGSLNNGILSASSRRLLYTQADTDGLFATWNTNTPAKDPTRWSASQTFDQAWYQAGERNLVTAHICGWGLPRTCQCTYNNGVTTCIDSSTSAPCQPQRDDCIADVVASLVYYTVSVSQSSTFSVANANSASVATVTVPAGAFGVPSAQLVVRAYPNSLLVDATNTIDLSRANDGFGNYFTWAATQLSPAFECVVTDPSVNQPFAVPLVYTAQIDTTRYPDYRDICLATVVTTPVTGRSDLKLKQWECLQPVRNNTNVPMMYTPALTATTGVTYTRITPLGMATATFDRCPATGAVYAFIHSPRFVAQSEKVYSNTWLSDNIVWLILGLSGVLAFLLLAVYFCLRLSRYRKKYHNTREEVDQAEENVQQKMNFGAGAGRQNADVMLTDNPLVTQVADLAITDQQMQTNQEEMAAMQEEALRRQEALRAVAEDKERLAQQLAMLQNELQKTEVEAPRPGPSSRRELAIGGRLAASGPTSMRPGAAGIAPEGQTNADDFQAETVDQTPMSRRMVDRAASKQRML